MSLFGNDYANQAVGAAIQNSYPAVKRRTIREQITDKIAFHKSEVTNLEAALDALTPEVEKFIDAAQKVNL